MGHGNDAPPAEARLTVIDPRNTDVPSRQLVVRPWTRHVHVFTLLTSAWRVWERPPDVEEAIQKGETTAVRILRDIHRAQVAAAKDVVIDMDADGVGEFATLQELTGGAAGRRRDRLKPYLPRSYLPKPHHHGDLVLEGYRIRLYFPGQPRTPMPPSVSMNGRSVNGFIMGTAGGWYTSSPRGKSDMDMAKAETHWWAYAWPEDLEETGRRTFYIDQDGVVWGTESWAGAYAGIGAAPAADAAFAAPGRYPGGVSPALRSADGNRWKRVP